MNTLVQEDPTLLEEDLSASEDEEAGVCMCFFEPWSLFTTTPQHSVMSISSDNIGSTSDGSH